MDWIWMTMISVIVFLYLLQQSRNLKKKKKYPPGPKGLPILGHLHLFGKNPHHDLRRLALKHGGIMRMRLGSVPIVVVSSQAAAELFLKTHDLVFANRPEKEASIYLSYEHRNIVFGNYGSYWRSMRKLCTLELLSNLKISQFQPMRKAELGLLVSSIKQAAEARETVDLSLRITSHIADVICLMVFGRKFEDRDLDERGFKEMMKDAMKEIGAFNLGDYFPCFRGLDLQGISHRTKNISKIFDVFLDRIIDDHIQNNNQEEKQSTQDFVDTMTTIMESGEAGFDFDRRHIKAVLLDMLIAGSDTSSTAVEWVLSEVIKHPTVMTKLQKELEEMVGMNQMVEESHLSKLKYLDYVVREALRLHPVGPIVFHESTEDCEVDGLHIPKKTQIFINIWAIGRDPNAWTNPDIFSPERFVGSDVDLRGRDFQLIPFGSGRRACPGLQLGLTMVQSVVAQLVHCFDWELPHGKLPTELDMSEDFGLVTPRAKHLKAIPTYRLHK